MLIKPIQIVMDASGNQIDLNYRPIRSQSNYRHIIQIVAPNLATEAVDVTVSTYGKEIVSETTRTRLAVDANGTYLKGSAVVDEDETYYSAVSQYNVWEVELVGPVASIIQKVNSSKVAIVVSFSMPVVDSRALVNVGSFGSSGDLPTITTETDGDYRVCDSLAYTSTLISTEFKYNDIAVVVSGAWIKGKVFRMIQTCPMIQLSVDPSLALMYDEPTDELATVLIDDVSRVDGIVSDVQTKVNTATSDILNINQDITNIELKNDEQDGRLEAVESKDNEQDGRLNALEFSDQQTSLILEDMQDEINLNTSKISFDSASSSKLAGIEVGATADQTPSEIKSAYESNANTNAYTDAEKSKLAGLESSKFLGTYLNLSALNNAHPTAPEGSYAHVDAGADEVVSVYIWDNSDSEFVIQQGSSTEETAASIKSKYESNPDTNAYTDAEKSKLAGLTQGSDVEAINDLSDVTITSPTNGQVLKYDGEKWINGSDNIGESGGVDSVNGESGTVTLDTDDINEGVVNLYYTEARVSANSNVVANTAKVSFDSTSSAKLATIEEGAQVNEALASQVEAEAGTEATKTMTPLRVAQAIAAQAITSETNTSLTLVANILKYTDETGTPHNIDLSLYLDDTNLARIISGTYNSELQTLVFTRDDESTFSIDASMFFDDTNLVTSVNGATGVVTLDTDDVNEGTTNKYADANATNQGNTFNGNSQLVQTTADGKLPVLDGSNLTGLPSSVALANYTGSLPTTGWTGASAPYSYALTVSGIISTDLADIDLDLSSSTYGDVAGIETSYSKIYRAVGSTDTITFYASEVPTIAVPLKIKVVR